MDNPDNPSVFLSYTHESKVHIEWVRRLAEDLTKSGVKTVLDQWDLRAGDDIGQFMEQSLVEAKYIVLVGTETYARRANDREGGAGYEQAVIVGNLLMSRKLNSKFIPIIRSGEPSLALPIYLQSRLFIDFRDDNAYGGALNQLLRRLFGAPAFTRPGIGEKPEFVGSVNPERAGPEGGSRQSALGGPRGWILVAGTGNTDTLDSKLGQTCVKLGVSLANSGYGIVTGGWRGVDEQTARHFARELARTGIPLEDRLTQVVVEDSVPRFAAGQLVLVHRGEEEWTEQVKRADAVVLVGGVGGTWKTGLYALEFGRLTLPLADTGGDAAKLYMHMQRNWKLELAPGIERSKFLLIAREAPDVVTEVTKILDEQAIRKVKTTV
jgi:TIR domain